MINADMRSYDYYLYGEADEYGQAQLSDTVQGQIKMAINISSQRVQENILFEGAEYVGLTHANADSTYVIQYDDNTKLKVTYVNPKGRFKQVYMVKL